MHPNERILYSPITERQKLKLPGDARVAVWLIVNVEQWNPLEPMPRTVLPPPAGGLPSPDVANWSWHEYGNRVGFWRILELLDNLKIRPALAINGSVITAYEPIARAARERDWEFIGHGFTQKNMQKVPNEREEIAKTTEAIRKFTGCRPRGWLGPGLTETLETPEILVEAGYEYVCDWVLDDQPVRLSTRNGSLVAMPYTLECNDVAIIAVQGRSGQEYRDRAIDQIDQLILDAKDSPRVMALTAHPYLLGVPHRLRYLREALEYICRQPDILFWTGAEIYDWYLSQSSGAGCVDSAAAQ